MAQHDVELAGNLPDVSGLSLHDLNDLDDSVFARELRALLSPARYDGDAIARFSSYSDPE